MNAKVVFADVLNDALLLGSLAASIFVKSVPHQALAANLINASAQLIQVIDAQLTGTTAAPVSTQPATVASPAPAQLNTAAAPTTQTVAIP